MEGESVRILVGDTLAATFEHLLPAEKMLHLLFFSRKTFAVVIHINCQIIQNLIKLFLSRRVFFICELLHYL